MKAIIKELCKIAGIIEGEIKTAPMSNEDESEEVNKLIRAKIGIENAISNIQDWKGKN